MLTPIDSDERTEWIVLAAVAAIAVVGGVVIVKKRRSARRVPPFDPLEWRRGGCGGGAPRGDGPTPVD